MKRGKQTCRILKEIRRRIAEANDIEFVTSECPFKGDCYGTCPACEAEVMYLEQQLRARQLMGKAVMLVGITAGMAGLTNSGNCSTLQAANVSFPADHTALEASTATADRTQKTKTATPRNRKPIEEMPVLGNSPEIMPVFPGGDAALIKYIAESIVYPDDARLNKIEGKVIIHLKILEDGSVDSVRVVRGKYPSLDEEAVRVIKTLPKFKPGLMNGKAASFNYTIPVVFKLPPEDLDNENKSQTKPKD